LIFFILLKLLFQLNVFNNNQTVCKYTQPAFLSAFLMIIIE